jgi:hypothetical protein
MSPAKEAKTKSIEMIVNAIFFIVYSIKFSSYSLGFSVLPRLNSGFWSPLVIVSVIIGGQPFFDREWFLKLGVNG